MLVKKYSNKIAVKKANALHLDFIKKHSIDWIDADGFLAYFDKEMLVQLIREWKRILKKGGYITFRECSGEGFGSLLNKIRLSIGIRWMKIPLYEHTASEIKDIFEKEGFSISSNAAPIPTFDRFIATKKIQVK